MEICVIGAGYVGLIAAVAFAKFSNKVICVEKNGDKVNKLNNGVPTIYEEGLEELLNECLEDEKLLFTTDINKAVRESDIIFIAVGTPTCEDWNVDTSQLFNVINQISSSIHNYKIIVTKSTVPVGTQKNIKKQLINNGVSPSKFDVVSNPEFLREGKALNDFLQGDKIVIGSDSLRAKSIMEKLYTPFNIKILFTNPSTAELIKYASNAFLATKISFINEIANFCTKTGADIDIVAYGLGLDKRISKEFFKAGLGYGGSCFPKDTKALVKIGEKYDSNFDIIRSVINVNDKQRLMPVKILLEHYNDLENKVISILGLTFKPGTDDIREAPALYIIKELISQGAIIKCYDLMASNEIKDIYPTIDYCNNVYDCVEDSYCAIVCTELDEFINIDLKKMRDKMQVGMIIDGRNIYNINDIEENGFDFYYSIGKQNKN
ncbi:MAG: UDP-glucose/GDP-mannose dehydrogenase family protein [Vallitalea sp.]|nr:UDP-glucose/GDP-mannose dehydrogenase family protein [Vallitalea sp.]